MSFDGTITAGSLLEAIVLLIGFSVAFTRLGGKIDLLSLRLQAVEEDIKDHREVSSRLAVIETRLSNQSQMIVQVQKDISELRRGEGWITEEDRHR